MQCNATPALGRTTPFHSSKQTANLFGPNLGFAENNRRTFAESIVRFRHPLRCCFSALENLLGQMTDRSNSI